MLVYDELTFLSVADAGRQIASKALSPVALVDAYLDRIVRLDSGLNSYLCVLNERARAQARDAEAEIAAGVWRGPLHGVPFAVKDNYFTAGVRTCAASRLLLDHVPATTATAILRLEAAGAILLGKLNTWEYGTGSGAVNFDLPFEPARNPWNRNHFTGGSSSGAGAAVAAGLAAFALGTDTGGSIRLPAAGCGVLGLKPTFGLVSRAHILPNCWSLDVAGPLTRTAHDAAIVLNVLAGYDDQDPATVVVPESDYTAGLEAGVRGMRLGVITDFGTEAPTPTPSILEGLAHLARTLEAAGARIVGTKLPAAYADYKRPLSVINWAESYSIHEQDFLNRGAEMGQALRDKMMSGFCVRAADYLAAQRQRRVRASEVDALINQYDALILPCTSITAPPISDGEAVIGFTRDAFTAPFNISGHPVMATPTGFDADGLPTSAQIVGRHFGEATVLAIAAAYGSASDWSSRRPILQELEP